MTSLVLVRHALTDWNLKGRLQGRKDVPLTDKGRAEAKNWKLPSNNNILWSSPLERAVETAIIAFGRNPRKEKTLIEMDWGLWEGSTLPELRDQLGNTMRLNEERGLDMRPEGGESPREVQQRLLPWLNNLQNLSDNHVAVTHKGVIRAVLALATNWDMIESPPIKLTSGSAYAFTIKHSNTVSFTDIIPLQKNFS